MKLDEIQNLSKETRCNNIFPSYRGVPKCSLCNDTGKFKYLPIEFVMYGWQKYAERECRCKTQITSNTSID